MLRQIIMINYELLSNLRRSYCNDEQIELLKEIMKGKYYQDTEEQYEKN